MTNEEDWLEETYNRSFDKCERITPEETLKLVELSILCDKLMRYSDDDEDVDFLPPEEDGITEYFDKMSEPFMTNMKAEYSHLIESAAKATAAPVRIGPPRPWSNGHTPENKIGVYSDQKITTDLSNFWKAFEVLKDKYDKEN